MLAVRGEIEYPNVLRRDLQYAVGARNQRSRVLAPVIFGKPSVGRGGARLGQPRSRGFRWTKEIPRTGEQHDPGDGLALGDVCRHSRTLGQAGYDDTAPVGCSTLKITA